MKDKEINKKVINLISEVLNVKNLSSKSSQENTEQWDSLAYLSIIAKLENEFKIKINQKNINNFGSIKKIVDEIKSCLTK
jgi:acyl carrier protein|tara:strand:- start:70 stop:309 length:240 start_codon:yes stop_codon:yes gene_type:complete